MVSSELILEIILHLFTKGKVNTIDI